MKRKILIVDDETEVCHLLKKYLEEKDFEISVLDKVKKWDDIFQYGRPDLIFLDYRMSPVTGKEILEMLQFEADPLPVIMMSAYRTATGIFEAEQLGAYAYIAKPFDFSELESLLLSVFS